MIVFHEPLVVAAEISLKTSCLEPRIVPGGAVQTKVSGFGCGVCGAMKSSAMAEEYT